MIERYMFLGYSDGKISPKNGCSAAYIAAARLGRTVLLYVEAEGSGFSPEAEIEGDMILFPDGKGWARLANIFYYNSPNEHENWERCGSSVPKIQAARLKYGSVSPYVFYHYQLQEENQKRKSRYYLIGLFGNLIVSYDETPRSPASPRRGCLETHNSPVAKWHERMSGFFESYWVDAEIIFKKDYLAENSD